MPYAKLVVGLTGGIGSGKSTVAALFAQQGVTIIDADQLSRDITTPDSAAYQQIISRFGADIILENKHLNRKSLRKLIFANRDHRQWLERLLHPLIREEMQRRVTQAESPYCIIVIPLIFETEPNPLLNRILVVDAAENLQIERTRARDTHTQAEVEAIMQTQVTRTHRLHSADDVIVNDGKLEDLEPQIEKLHNFYLDLSKKSFSSG
jgi:dephospho-CoA kinase